LPSLSGLNNFQSYTDGADAGGGGDDDDNTTSTTTTTTTTNNNNNNNLINTRSESLQYKAK
jgi:hypothetical protein